MKSKVKQHSKAFHTWATNVGLGLALLVLAWHLHGSATINFFNTPTTTNTQSDDSPMDSTFSFEVGTFDTGFTPTAANVGEWAAHWNPMPLAVSPVTYNDATNDFQGTAMLTDNNVFAEGTQSYIWGYTSKTASEGSPAEWVLLTNDSWDVPDAVQDEIGENPPNIFWSVDDIGTTTLLGDITSEEIGGSGSGFFANAIQSASVPEPGAGLLLLLAASAGMLCRRR